MKNSVRILILLLSQLTISLPSHAQRTPAANAVKLSDSLTFVTASASAQSAVVYNPVFQKYYSVRAGASTFPLETWNLSGGLSIVQTTAGLDSRGMWWNPNTNQVERNCFSAIGWGTVNLDASGNALNTFSMLFTGQKQPDVQSVGAYDFKTNTVIYNNSGTLSIYDRNTGLLTGTMPLTGTSLANINIYSVIYTGETGFEIGILDWSAKKILLFNRATGIFSGSSQLPATAITNNQFRFSYANNRVWLFNVANRTWNSYNIWNQPLPIKLLSFSASVVNSKETTCKWTTAVEINNDFFTVERSKDGDNFEEVGFINGSGNSTKNLDYIFADEHPYSGVSYYRLKQTDFDGRFSYSDIVAVNIKDENEKFFVYPNPASDIIKIQRSTEENTSLNIELYDMDGRIVFADNKTDNGANPISTIDVSKLPKGVYVLKVIADNNAEQQRIIIR